MWSYKLRKERIWKQHHTVWNGRTSEQSLWALLGTWRKDNHFRCSFRNWRINLRCCCWHLIFKLLHEGYFQTIFLSTNYCHFFNFQVVRQQSIILPSTYVHTCFLAQGFHQVLSHWLLQDPKTIKNKNMLKYGMIRAMSQFLYPGGKLSIWQILWELSSKRWKKKGGAYNDLW